MRKNTITLIIAVGLTLLTGAVTFYVTQIKNSSETNISNNPSKTTSIKLDSNKRSIKDTTVAKHTIVIENVDDPRQLQEILTLLESYSAEHQIKDLNITTNKENVLK